MFLLLVHLHDHKSQEDHPLLLDVRPVLQLPLVGPHHHQGQLCQRLRPGRSSYKPRDFPVHFIFLQVPKCDFKHSRASNMYIAMFFADITLFYLIPLVLSVVLYTLISIMLLYTAPRTFNDGSVRNQARLQVEISGSFLMLWTQWKTLLRRKGFNVTI